MVVTVAGAVSLLASGPLVAQSEDRAGPGKPPAGPTAKEPSPARTSSEASPDENAPGQSVQVATSDLSSLNRLLPIGKTARKVTVPTVDEEGRLTSVVTMGAITRVDEDNFDLEKVVLTSYDQPDAETPAAAPSTTVITLINARYHAPTRLLVSERPVTIRKPTLFLTGDSLRYDSAAGRALMKGNTRAIITDAPRLDPAADADAGAGENEDEVETEDENEDETEDETIDGKEAASSPSTPKPQ
jgi:hypothetical protein